MESYTKHKFNPKVLYPKIGGKKSCSCLIIHTDPIYLVPQSKYYEKEYFYYGYRHMGQKHSIIQYVITVCFNKNVK